MSYLKTSSKGLLKKTLFQLKLYRFNSLKNRCYILMYHMVPDTPTGFYAEVKKSDFEFHIKHLAENYNIISLTEYVRRVKNNESLRGCVVITFDDGFKDNYVNAYPILKKYNVPATIFLLAGRIEDGAPPWFIKFRYMFMMTEKETLDIKLGEQSFHLPLTSRDEKKTASSIIMSHLQKVMDKERLEYISKLEESLKMNDFGGLNDIMMIWDEIKEMADNNIEFGAHTINHQVLSRLSYSKAEEEIASSKILIEEKTGIKMTTFAYPFGKNDLYNEDTINILKKLSFECSVTTEIGPADHSSDLFQIPRCFQGVVRLQDLYWEPYSLSIGSY